MARMGDWQAWIVVTTALCTALQPPPALALPTGGATAAGASTIDVSGQHMDITQSTTRAVIDWRSYDVEAGEGVSYHQPSASSISLNRIRDSKASRIDGSIDANGQVWLVNSEGMFFGK